MSESSESQVSEAAALKAELVRLRIKRSDTEDADIAKALDERIAQLEAQMPKAPVVEEVMAEPPTPEQLAEAEQLTVQARVEKMRGNAKSATDLLKRAAEVAPGSPTVLEALGDDLVERRQLAQARDAYKRAVKLDPKNVGLERKFAMTVSSIGMAGSIDDQLRRNLSDSPFASDSGATASLGGATFLSAMFPGLGHVVLGRKSGYAIMVAWVACFVWAFLHYRDMALIFSMGSAKGSANMVVLVPIFLMFAIYLGTLASLRSRNQVPTKRVIQHPVPPVDRPFEL